MTAGSEQCTEEHSQCNAQHCSLGACCKDWGYVCTKKTAYLRLCEPVRRCAYPQCGGEGYTGVTTCEKGSTCVKVHDSCCHYQPTPVRS